jgi:hypothetical protein
MQTRRLLFVQPPRAASLAPIYVALLLLFAVSLLGFLIAFWPEDTANAASRRSGGEATPAGRAFEGGMRVTPDASKPPSRRVWA